MIRTVLRVIIWFVPIEAYITVFLLLGVEQGANFWVSICFLAFSYLMLAASFIAVPRSRIASILSMPLTLLASIYLVLEFIMATAFIYVPSSPFSIVIVTQLVLATLFIVIFALTMLSNEAIAAQIEEQHADVQIIKSAVARLGTLRRNTQEPQIAKSIERLEEEFRYSPTSRSGVLYATDEEIGRQLGRLESLVTMNAAQEAVLGQISAISGALAARNSDIKLQQ